MVDQYYVDEYRIDLYLSKYILAVKCDEFGHEERNIGYKFKQQKNIESKIGCTINRYNLNGKGFSIFKVINRINSYDVRNERF